MLTVRPGDESRLPVALRVVDWDARMDVTGASAAGTRMRGRTVATRWPVTADFEESPPERRPGRKRFAQGFRLGAAATAIAGLAVLAT